MYCLWPHHYYKLGVHCTVFIIVLLEFQYYKHKLFSWGRSMTPTLLLTVLLEFQYYKQKLFCQMYKSGGMPLQEEPSDWRRPPNNCLSLEAQTNFSKFILAPFIYSRIRDLGTTQDRFLRDPDWD